MGGCGHPVVLVDYDHPHGTLVGVPVADLRGRPAAGGRPVLALRNPRCRACGQGLSGPALAARTRPGGDLHDERFAWS